MSKVLVNIRDELQAAGLPRERLQRDWIKTIVRLNKEVDDGFSLVGDFVKKEDCLALQSPGLYLLHDRTQKIPFRSELFELLPNGKIQLIDHQECPTKDWAVHLWEPIDKWLAHQQQIKKELSRSLARAVVGDTPPAAGTVLGGELGTKLRAMQEQRQKPLFDYIIKYAIHGHSHQPYKVRTAEIDFSEVERGDFSKFLEDIAQRFDVHRSQLPKVSHQGIWTLFYVPEPGDDQ